jgi:LysM repeat protein
MIVRPLQAAAALLTSVLCLALAACKSTRKGDEIVDYTSPDTGLSPAEYPFDADGNYREDWASGGTARDVPSNKVEDLYSDPVKTEEKPKRSSGTTAAVTGASAGSVAAVTPKPKTTSTSSARSSASAQPKVTSSSSSRSRPSSSSSRSGTSSKPKTSTAKTSTKAKPKPKPVAKAKPKPKPAPPKPKPTYVKVQQGDTLSSISRRTGVPVSSLKSYNGMKSDFLRTGQTLTVPPRKR